MCARLNPRGAATALEPPLQSAPVERFLTGCRSMARPLATCALPLGEARLSGGLDTPNACQGSLTGMTDAARLASELSSKDPAVGLRAIASLRVLLQSLEQLQVDNARAQGWSWQQIAAALGVSRQAVHEKHGRGRRMFGPRR